MGLHASVLWGWPAVTPVAFDVERAPRSLEIRLVAPRQDQVSPQPVPGPVVAEAPPELVPEVEPQPEPVPQTLVTPELQGALSDVLPSYRRNPAPVYPWLARQRGEEGTVVLRVEVLPTGRCGRLDVRASSGSTLLDTAALHTVKGWQFKPARRGQLPVAVWVEIPITFELIDAGGF